MINRTVLQGRLTNEPEQRTTPGGHQVTAFVLANNRGMRKTASGEEVERTTFLPCTVWGKLGDVVMRYCRKGTLVVVDGTLETERWTDKKNGEPRTKTNLVVSEISFAGAKQSPEDQTTRPGLQDAAVNPVGKDYSATAPRTPKPVQQFADDDLPPF